MKNTNLIGLVTILLMIGCGKTKDKITVEAKTETNPPAGTNSSETNQNRFAPTYLPIQAILTLNGDPAPTRVPKNVEIQFTLKLSKGSGTYRVRFNTDSMGSVYTLPPGAVEILVPISRIFTAPATAFQLTAYVLDTQTATATELKIKTAPFDILPSVPTCEIAATPSTVNINTQANLSVTFASDLQISNILFTLNGAPVAEGLSNHYSYVPTTAGTVTIGAMIFNAAGFGACGNTLTVVVPPPLLRTVYSLTNGAQHMPSLSSNESGWTPYESSFQILQNNLPGSTPIWRCASGMIHLLSTQTNCEGLPGEGQFGYIYTTPVAGTVPLYRHHKPDDVLVIKLSNVPGYTSSLLGYVYP